MKIHFVEIYKNQKTEKIIEDKINAILESGAFKYATQVESSSNGKITFSVITDGEVGKTKAKVFRASHIDDMTEKVNKFLSDSIKLKMFTYSVTANTMVGIVYYDK